MARINFDIWSDPRIVKSSVRLTDGMWSLNDETQSTIFVSSTQHPGCSSSIKKNRKLAHSGADQRERKMRLVVFTVLVCRWWMVCGIGRCPFPGITANSKFNSSSINWQNGTSFQEGDVVEYTCPDIWRKISGLRYSVSCRSDGTWTNHPPRCGNEDII